MSLTLYAIRHIPTQRFMPSRMFRHSAAGYTYWEPTGAYGCGGEPNSPPRLFPTRYAASLALNAWVRGNYRRRYVKVQGGFDEPPEDWPVGTESTPPPTPRTKAEMEIVTFSFTEI